MPVQFGRFYCLDPLAVARRCAEQGMPTQHFLGRANRFECRLGQDPGTGWLLMVQQDLSLLNLNGPHDLTFTSVDHLRARAIKLRNLQIVKYEVLLPGRLDDPKAIVLVEIADRRRQYRQTAIDKAYNLRETPGGAYYSGTLNSGNPWTWAEMVGDIWSAVGKLGVFPGLPFAPNGQPDGWTFWGSSAWTALGQVLDRLQCKLALNPVADTFRIVRVGATDAAYDAALKARQDLLTWDDDPAEAVKGRIPEKVRVLFLKQPTQPGTSAWYTVDVADAAADVETQFETGTKVMLHDDLPAIYNTSGTLTNQTALETRAAERAADYFRALRKGADRQLRVYFAALGDRGLLPGSQVLATAWEERGAGVRTTIWSAAGGVKLDPNMPGNMADGDEDGGGGGGGPEFVLRVREVDGTPSYAPIHIIEFDQADGFVVSQPAVGTARIDLSATVGALTVRELDGVPSVLADTLIVPNTVLFDAGAGDAQLRDASATTGGFINLVEQGVGSGDKIFQDRVIARKVGSPKTSDVMLWCAGGDTGTSFGRAYFEIRDSVSGSSVFTEIKQTWSSGLQFSQTIDFAQLILFGAVFQCNVILDHRGGGLQFFNVTGGALPASQQTVTGSRGGNAALESLMIALRNYGLVVDLTTP